MVDPSRLFNIKYYIPEIFKAKGRKHRKLDKLTFHAGHLLLGSETLMNPL